MSNLSDGTMQATPVSFIASGTLDRIALSGTSAGATDTVIRFGIYDDSGDPGALVLDADTVPVPPPATKPS